jgi:hypothetical protein
VQKREEFAQALYDWMELQINLINYIIYFSNLEKNDFFPMIMKGYYGRVGLFQGQKRPRIYGQTYMG